MPKSKIQVVNDNDEIIGHKDRAKINYKKDIYRITALWITNSKGEVLIAQRKHTKDKDPGKWGPAVAGTMDEGETYEENIYKEAKEELGIENVKFIVGPKQRRYTPRNFFCQWFLLNIDRDINQFKIQAEEVEQIAWIGKRKLIDEARENPDKYIPSMPEIIKLFLS